MPAAWYQADSSDGDARRLIRHLDEALALVCGRAPQRLESLDDLLAALEPSPGDPG